VLLLELALLSGCSRGLQTPRFHVPSADEFLQTPAAQRLRAGAKGANLIIVSLDAARADHFTSFGYELNTTPHLASFFDDSVLFTEAYAAGASTKPAVTSLFTAQFPDTHGTHSLKYAMTAEGATLAQCLSAAGFTTAAFSASPAVSASFGFSRGFRTFEEIFREVGMHAGGGDLPRDQGWVVVDGARVLQAATRWIGARSGERFFVYIHFREPHSPYGASESFRAETASPDARPVGRSLGRYDEGLAYADALVAQLLRELRARNLWERSIIVFLADHGEGFGEHGVLRHDEATYQEIVHVPLAIHLPTRCGVSPQRRREVFCLTDLMPTLLDLLQLPPPATMQGRSRLALLTGEREKASAFAVSRAFGKDQTGGVDRPDQVSYAWRDARYTLLLADRGRRVELYDRATDPGEAHDLAAREPWVVARLRKQFAAWAATQRGRPVVLPGGRVYVTQVSDTQMEDEVRRQLKALGYLK